MAVDLARTGGEGELRLIECSDNLRFTLNHMTVPQRCWRELLRIAVDTGCSGIELRNDLPEPLFGGDTPEEVASVCADAGLAIPAVAEVPGFNDGTSAVLEQVATLAAQARRAGAEAVVLIPRMGGAPVPFENLCAALDKIGVCLANEGVKGMVEPLGFAASTLRFFDVARAAIRETHGPERFGIVHDTFHHHLAGAEALSAEMVGMVHISGVTTRTSADHMRDADRGLVDSQDRLGNIEQIEALTRDGYAGPVSMEAFAPDVHGLQEPEVALRASFDFIHTSLKAHAA